MRENLKILKNFIEFRGCGTVVEDAFNEIAAALGEEFISLSDEQLEKFGELLYDLRQVRSSVENLNLGLPTLYDIRNAAKEMIENTAKILADYIGKGDVGWYLKQAKKHLSWNYERPLYENVNLSPGLILRDIEMISDNGEYISIAFLEVALYLSRKNIFGGEQENGKE